jgi:glycosyltransferase involved in cell wall biosynthesis
MRAWRSKCHGSDRNACALEANRHDLARSWGSAEEFLITLGLVKPPDAGARHGGPQSTPYEAAEETRRLGEQYGEAYFAEYGRGFYQWQTAAPYRHGEPLWESYFAQIADLIVSELAPQTVLDAGCAIGFLVEALRARGVEVWGIDISEYAIAHVDETVRDVCSIASVTDELDRDYDLIVCIEVLEHLPQHLAAFAIANFARHARQVLFSASSDGFRDPTHLNVQPTDYWVELFGRHGFFRNLDVDAGVVAPQAMHLVRDEQTAVSVARAYERWHWRVLTELRDLREARQFGAEQYTLAERAKAQLGKILPEFERYKVAAERAQAGLAELEHYKAAAERAEAEIELLRQTRTFRYTAWPRAQYGRLRWVRRRHVRADDAFRECVTSSEDPSQGQVRYWIDSPREGQMVAADLLLPVRGWVVCERGVVARIDLTVNGVGSERARLGLARPDVAAHIDRADAFISGFETLLDLAGSQIEDHEAKVEVFMQTLNGERHLLDSVTVRLTSTGEPRVDELPAVARRRTVQTGDIRLLVFTHHLGLGGGQLYLFELLRLLSRRPGFSATLVAPADGPLRRATEALGIPVVISGPQPVGSLDLYAARQDEMAQWARAGSFNAVLGNTLMSFPGIDLGEQLGLPAVWAVHESYSLRAFWHAAYGSADVVHPLVKARAENAFASAAAVVFEADATRELFADHGDPDRFVTVPYGIDVAEIAAFAASTSRAEARRRLKLPESATILLCLGTIEPRKSQAALAEAFSTIAPEHPEAILVFVGAGQDQSSDALHDFIRKSGLANRIRLVPVTSEIYPWYRAVDAVVSASDVESLPRTVLEAMAFSVPVIATRVFGLPELIEDGVTGYLCDPRDVSELARTLARFLDTPAATREAVGAAGASLVRERHDSRSYADLYHRLLRALVVDPGQRPSDLLAGD